MKFLLEESLRQSRMDFLFFSKINCVNLLENVLNSLPIPPFAENKWFFFEALLHVYIPIPFGIAGQRPLGLKISVFQESKIHLCSSLVLPQVFGLPILDRTFHRPAQTA